VRMGGRVWRDDAVHVALPISVAGDEREDVAGPG
jgi:hypothetical protein